MVVAAVWDDDGTGRSMISGGGTRRQPRPIRTPASKRTAVVIKRCSQYDFPELRKHLSQNFRLVHTRQRKRTIFSPHSQQKFGR